jgi:hypothetical protein
VTSTRDGIGVVLPLPTSLSGPFTTHGARRVAGEIATSSTPCATPLVVAISKLFHARAPPSSMAAVGDGYSLYGNGWKSVAVGGLFEDMPDFEYACWAAQAYREAFRTAQPVFEDVAATVRLRHAGLLRLQYRRVILPIGSGEQPTLLLGATLQQSVRRLSLGADDELRDILQ